MDPDEGPRLEALMELWRALGVLGEPPGLEQIRLAEILGLPGRPEAAHYTEIFVLHLYPYASVYLGGDGMLGGEARDRIAGFWRALGRVPPVEPDHLTTLLALYATLGEHESTEREPARRVLLAESRKALLWEHLACWLPMYLDKLRDIASPCYRAWGEMLGEALREALVQPGRPDALPLHLREAPPLPDPRQAGAAAFLQGLLAPVRSGALLVRADLARAARDTELGLRMGERRFMLDALLSQDATRTLAWLEAEVRAWIPRHLAHRDAVGGIAEFWAARAETAADLLARLAAEGS
ncbi:MAG TPA: molecular chaperone TorD family protein [bacterium]|nr:molecular chaperone TorD family protein [bacterium]